MPLALDSSVRASSRRAWLQWMLALCAMTLPARTLRAGSRDRIAHPTPRKGVTAAKVPTASALTRVPSLIALFDAVREIPHLVDGIGCHCGCAALVDTHYSLLSCYETDDAMAKVCPICQGEGRVAVRLAKAGKSLDEIRAAIDAQFG